MYPQPAYPQTSPNRVSPQSDQTQLPATDRCNAICGPLLRYIGIDYDKALWRGSCLVVSTDQDPAAACLQLELQSEDGDIHSIEVQGELLDSFRNQYHFWRFELQLPLLHESQKVTYWMRTGKTFSFHLAPINQSMRFLFYSCNGFSDIPQAIKNTFGHNTAPLWVDVLDRHEVIPFHVMIGGGDQLYQDALIHKDFMKPWRDEKNPRKRIATQLSQPAREGFEEFYFWNYIRNFGFEDNPIVAKAFASIPSINMWDDHVVLFANASRFYLLFQHHTTIKLAQTHGLIKGVLPTCQHIVTTLGPEIGFVALDGRGERTKYDICRPKSYDIIFDAMYHLPQSIKHVLLVTGVPIVYPRLTLFERVMESAANFNLATLAGKTGALGNVVSGQLNKWNGDPELLDDMNDRRQIRSTISFFCLM
ncbi:hypothetical protein EC973_005446 [Apophysomyces ossiformis]|uniref:PhoD-like phosphatase domain-containing protein n=1 Tax=Apophysomyces ossiformis TaxID=679940 RepID=A0A8H7BPC6_9FUNG|nr:hypothetical protein EC973_005446 [Apophysomyces ossiformis]